MKTSAKKWGNSAAVRIPASEMQATRLLSNTTILEYNGGELWHDVNPLIESSMPLKRPLPHEDRKLDTQSASLEYSRLLAFLQVASGFNLALAICNLPSLREQLIQDASQDAAKFGAKVVAVRLSGDSSRDFATAVRKSLGENGKHERLVAMILGLDELINETGDEQALIPGVRPASVARLNMDRERIAEELPYPLVLWVERETASVLFKKAPDLSQWISARFDFAGLEPAYYSLGEYRTAIEFHEQSLKIAREIGDLRAEGNALGNLGNAYASPGEYRRAIEFYEQHLKIAREIGDLRGEGNALWNMSLTFDLLGDRARAVANAEAALKILEQVEYPNAGKIRTQLAAWQGIPSSERL